MSDQTLPPILTSRSTYETGLECRRRRWWNYEYPTGDGIRGIEPRKMALPLATGQYVHLGLALVLKGNPIDEAVRAACLAYTGAASERGLSAEVSSDIAYTIAEQTALIEALVRTWHKVRYEDFITTYDVLDVEREEYVQLSPDVGWMARPDAVVRRRSDQLVFVLSFKTLSRLNPWWLRGFDTDIQTMSEVYPVEQRLGETLGGVLVEGLIKGDRKQVKDSEKVLVRVEQSSPLIYGYCAEGIPGVGPEWTHEYKRAKGWSRKPVWERMSIKEWLDRLPIEVLEDQLVTLPPVMRQIGHIESWKTQVAAEEVRVRAAREWAYGDGTHYELDAQFPQNTRACQFPSPCPFIPICFSGVDEPLESGMYIKRVANHPLEVGHVSELGTIEGVGSPMREST